MWLQCQRPSLGVTVTGAMTGMSQSINTDTQGVASWGLAEDPQLLYFPRGLKCTLALLINLSVAERNIRFICTVYREPVSLVGDLGLSEQGESVFFPPPGTLLLALSCMSDGGEMLCRGPSSAPAHPSQPQPLELRKGCGPVCGLRLHLQTGGTHNRWETPAF